MFNLEILSAALPPDYTHCLYLYTQEFGTDECFIRMPSVSLWKTEVQLCLESMGIKVVSGSLVLWIGSAALGISHCLFIPPVTTASCWGW